MKKLIGLIVVIVAACAAIPLLSAAALHGAGDANCGPVAAPVTDSPSFGDMPVVSGDWDAEQLANVATIIRVGNTKGVPPWGWVVAVATAIQESRLRNLTHLVASDHDSIGLFQQRPSQGWGTAAQLANPAYQAARFFDKLLAVKAWQQMPLTEAAQAVQRSAYPTAYAKWTSDAIHLVSQVGTALGLSTAAVNSCVIVSALGWTQPVRAPMVSGFRTRQRPGHQGVDLGAARHTVIRAAASGTVVRVRCDIEPVSWGCDRDGTPETPGCGWYIDVAHPGRVITRYCHMQSKPWVNVGDPIVAGQPVGTVGSSGHSSGPHLHFEVHVGADASRDGAIDPEPWMHDHGAPLGLIR